MIARGKVLLGRTGRLEGVDAEYWWQLFYAKS